MSVEAEKQEGQVYRRGNWRQYIPSETVYRQPELVASTAQHLLKDTRMRLVRLTPARWIVHRDEPPELHWQRHGLHPTPTMENSSGGNLLLRVLVLQYSYRIHPIYPRRSADQSALNITR